MARTLRLRLSDAGGSDRRVRYTRRMISVTEQRLNPEKQAASQSKLKRMLMTSCQPPSQRPVQRAFFSRGDRRRHARRDMRKTPEPDAVASRATGDENGAVHQWLRRHCSPQVRMHVSAQ